jgi:hypothetical protein
MRRLYFLIPGAGIARRVVDELRLMQVPKKHIGAIAKDARLLEKHDIPEAGLRDRSDIVPAIEKGIAAGGVSGLLAGLVAVSFPPSGLMLDGGAIFGTSVAGAAIGAVVAPMIGISAPGSRLEQFEQALELGQLLLIVDVPKEQVDDVSEVVTEQHPALKIEWTELTVLPLPKTLFSGQ